MRHWTLDCCAKLLLILGTNLVVLGNPALGEDTMPSSGQLQLATADVKETVINLKAFYGSKRPDGVATAGATALLKTWGEFTESEQIYFAASDNSGNYGLSLISDPGRWTAEKYPAFQLRRLQIGSGELDKFEVTFGEISVSDVIKERLKRAVLQLVATERSLVGKVGGRIEKSSNGGAFEISVSLQK